MPTKDKYKKGEVSASEKDRIEVDKARDSFVRWFEDPSTVSRFPKGLDREGGIRRAVGTRVESGFLNRGIAQYDHPAKAFNKEGNYVEIPEGEPGHYPGRIKTTTYDQSVLQHELSHAANFDDTLGAQLAETLGEKSARSFGGEYRKRYGELFGNFHQMRVKLDIQPWERNWTPEKLMELIQFQGKMDDEDVRFYIDEYGLDNVSKALNEIASVEADAKRLDRLNAPIGSTLIDASTSLFS